MYRECTRLPIFFSVFSHIQYPDRGFCRRPLVDYRGLIRKHLVNIICMFGSNWVTAHSDTYFEKRNVLPFFPGQVACLPHLSHFSRVAIWETHHAT